MLPSTTLEKSFCADLIRHKVFNAAETLVRDTYKLQVEAKQSEKKFVITAVGTELLDLAVHLLKSWLERKKRGKGDSIDERIKDTKENPLLDISGGHVMWVFWGELGFKLLTEDWEKNVERLRFMESASVTIQREPKEKRLCVTCNFECFEDVRKKVENLIKLVNSDISSSDKSQISESSDGYEGEGQSGTDGSKAKDQTDSEKSKMSDSSKFHIGSGGSKGSGQSHSEKLKMATSRDTGQIDPTFSCSGDKGGKDTKTGEMKATFDLVTSEWTVDLNKSEKPTTETVDSNARQSKGESGEHTLPTSLGGKENGSTRVPHSSASRDENSEKNKQHLFCTENGKIKVYVYEASIVSLSGIDAIVNAANEHLSHIGGVAYHISKTAGGDKSALEIECRNYIKKKKKVHVTNNFTSSAGNMPYIGVIHAVGPMWSDYKAKDDCAKDLCMTIVNVLMEADKKKFVKIAVPAISSGIYGVPKRLCAEMYIRGVVDYDRQNRKTCVREIHFVDIAKDILQEIRDAYERWKQNDNNINFKNANNYGSGSDSEFGKSADVKGSMHGNPAASWKRTSKMSIFRLSEKTCVKLYTCSIVDVKDVDAVACAIDAGFNVERRAVAKDIRRAGGTKYEEEFKEMVSHVSPDSRDDVFICGAGNLCRFNNIAYVIHIKVPKHFDMELVRHHYIQVFETARKWTMEKIAMPLIGAEKELPVHKSDGDQRNGENLSGTCSFPKCKMKVERRCKNCLKVVCKLCIMNVDKSETQCPFCNKNFNSEEKTTIEEQQGEPNIPSNEVDNCPICMDTLTSPKILPCGHKFHAECIDQSLKYKKTCPICGKVVGQLTGYQPPGKMYSQIREDITPPGFEKCGTIEISYDFPDGTQGEDHPHLGMPYCGTHRRAFLPNNTEGQKVYKLIEVAFKRKLNFTIGESRTTGKTNIVTWNAIHHKTRIDGGPINFGYPDVTYLKRVQEELADKGVTEKDIRGKWSTKKMIPVVVIHSDIYQCHA
ncbi:hypothetical protein ACJMK2_005779 [Sinanodonta woodiana]|uniref:E3 ubiquitin-protein ligase n=1 Tax=Sinanodonta woodiana TaxID=1069815 RepID=A0ABD3VU78_SINWO